MDIENLKFPIGKYQPPTVFDVVWIQTAIDDIASIPAQYHALAADLSDEILDKSYREGGWTLRQVIHHVADSHMNAYIRFKLALTEDNPTIKPYAEEKWAELPDSTLPIAVSLSLISNIHERWVYLLRNTPNEEFNRTLYHPGYKITMSLSYMLGLYQWHGRHHLAHVQGVVGLK